jgi:hypothetical protein
MTYFFRLFLACLLVIIISGCANTAKKNTDEDRILQFTLKFKAKVDPNAYQYFVAFSSIGRPILPFIPPALYFPTPGRTFNDAHPDFQNNTAAILGYYTRYFNTWSDYIVVDRQGISLFRSNGPGFIASKVDDHFLYLKRLAFEGSFAASGSTLIIRVPLSTLTISSARQVYYSIFTCTPTDSTESGTLRDILQDAQVNELVINVNKNAQIGPFFDSQDTSDPSLDLIEWSVDIL